MVSSALLVRAMARRGDLPLDYRAAGAAACTGFGSVWALGLSSSAALLQANAGSMPPGLLAETGVIPFSQTIFLWQSMLCAVDSHRREHLDRLEHRARRARGAHGARARHRSARIAATAARAAGRGSGWNTARSGDFHRGVGGVFLVHEFAVKGFVAAISNLNTYNFMFIIAGCCCSGGRGALSMRWRAACRASPAC